MTRTLTSKTIHSDLGTFEGFNFRNQSAIDRRLKANDVAAWDHDRDGEAEFWAAGDRKEMTLLFPTNVTRQELSDLDELLDKLGGDTLENFIRIYYAVSVCGEDLATVTSEKIEDKVLHVFTGESFLDMRRLAAFELFELYYPETYLAWYTSTCDGLVFDQDRFLDSPDYHVEEVILLGRKVLIVGPQ